MAQIMFSAVPVEEEYSSDEEIYVEIPEDSEIYDYLPENDELFAGYIDQQFFGPISTYGTNAREYIQSNGITNGAVLDGASLIDDTTAADIFNSGSVTVW